MMNTDKEKNRGRWEEALRSKLQNYEAETLPEDWTAIAGRLPEGKGRGKRLPLHVRRCAAAVIALLLLSAGGYFYRHRQAHRPCVDSVAGVTVLPETKEEAATPSVPAHPLPDGETAARPVRKETAPPAVKTERTPEREAAPEEVPAVTPAADGYEETEPAQPPAEETAPVQQAEASRLLADAGTHTPPKQHSPQKRWGLGMSGGSYSAGTNSGGAPMAAPSKFMVYNPETALRREREKQKVSHKYPVSFGLGASYALNGRWALQSGLTYTLLRSEWIALADCPGDARQRLHFIGLPLGASYRIAEWKKLRFYATGGVMTEWNVAGDIRTDYYNGGEKLRTERESVRMKEWLWSVNARVGASYPLLRFVNIYVEGGANYYFDNGSFIETVRSDKPFHVSLQAGVRLGF
ncbi:MAG: outer membrane beta-barrel protein [Tannerella sp.]|nr:outer membrane beta-barrel protein [Tannerella sp.]